MTLKGFAAVFLAACCAISVGTLATYRPPAIAPVRNDLADHGRRLVTRTFAEIGPESTKPFAGNRLACQNCHLEAGLKASGVPLVGIDKTYPKFSVRSGRVITLSERIDECMTRSMNGRKLPPESREMAAFIAYIRSLDGPAIAHQAPPAAAEPADATRGSEVYARVCAACHQPHGLGKRSVDGYEFPPLWGPDSFNDGAGMDHFERVVGFIQQNMPRGIDPAKPQLTLQEAWDVAAFLRSRPRPRYEAR